MKRLELHGNDVDHQLSCARIKSPANYFRHLYFMLSKPTDRNHVMVIVCGLPGTGKTTFAEALAQTTGAVHLNTDRVRYDAGHQGNYSESDKTAVYHILLVRSREVLESGHAIVLDGTFYQKALRRAFTQLAEDLNVRVLWIEMTASEATIRSRVSKSRPYSEADFDVYQKVKSAFEPLPAGHLVLDSDSFNIDGMVHVAQAYIRGANVTDI